MKEIYTEDFYRSGWLSTGTSARVVVPLVLQLMRPLNSVIDLGCGRGEWLAVFENYNIEDICGVDGEWVPREVLHFSQKRYVPYDLTRPFSMDREFDMVLSLEVAEHLPEECAETFVRSLTALGSAVLFSAGVPGQGGEHHVNEQWQGYWAKLFDHEGYVAVDCVRHRVWNDPRVLWFYAQNTILYVHRQRLENEPLLKEEYELHGTSQISVAHPEMVSLILNHAKSQRQERLESLRELLKQRQREQGRQIRDRDQRIQGLERQLRERDRTTQRLARQLRYRNRKLQESKEKRQRLIQERQRLRRRTLRYAQQLESIQASRAWKLVGVLRYIKAKTLSLGRSYSAARERSEK